MCIRILSFVASFVSVRSQSSIKWRCKKTALVHLMVWCRTANRPLPKKSSRSLTYLCIKFHCWFFRTKQLINNCDSTTKIYHILHHEYRWCIDHFFLRFQGLKHVSRLKTFHSRIAYRNFRVTPIKTAFIYLHDYYRKFTVMRYRHLKLDSMLPWDWCQILL